MAVENESKHEFDDITAFKPMENEIDSESQLCVPKDRLEDLDLFPNFENDLISSDSPLIFPNYDQLFDEFLPNKGTDFLEPEFVGSHEISSDNGSIFFGSGFLDERISGNLDKTRERTQTSSFKASNYNVLGFNPTKKPRSKRLQKQKSKWIGDTTSFGFQPLDEYDSYHRKGVKNYGKDLMNGCMVYGKGLRSACMRRQAHKTQPHWRVSPMGPRTLCNDCSKGVETRMILRFEGGSRNLCNACGKAVKRRCMHCQAEKTPQWREGPLGPKTLCNACGVRYKSGRLLPEYRPAASPSFDNTKHSNFHRKIMKRKLLVGERVKNDGCMVT